MHELPTYTALLSLCLFSHCWQCRRICACTHTFKNTHTHHTVNPTLPFITLNEYTRKESKGVCVCLSACLSKQCGGVWSDKASGRLLVQFLCHAADKRVMPVCIHTCINLHTYDILHRQKHTNTSIQTRFKPKPVFSTLHLCVSHIHKHHP